MSRCILSLVLACGLAFAACKAEPYAPSTDDLIVVRAYLYAGEPVTDVRITSSVPLGASDTVGPPVNNATVTLIRDGVPYPLVPTPGDSGYYHDPGGGLIVAVGDVFDLEVTHGGVTATGRTTVPPPPGDLSLSRTELALPTGGFGFGTPPDASGESLVVRWESAAGDLYFVTHENVESDPEPVETRFPQRFRFISEPTDADSTLILPQTLTHYGRHEVRVYRVNTEYAQLYASRQQDSRDLNEPATNIENGLGIFSAFSSRSARFTLTKE